MPELSPALLECLQAARGLQATAGNIQRLGVQYGQAEAAWSFDQWGLRKRAKAKFVRAEEMLFTRDGLEQASHERVAAYHASRFPKGEPVEDWTCGIGADLIALAGRGPATGYELDPQTAALARWNLKGVGDGEVIVGDCLNLTKSDLAFADPSRRMNSVRTRKLSEFQPDPREVARRFAALRLGGIKLSPMLTDTELDELGPCVEFVSYGGECREALVWCGHEAKAGRWAVHVESGDLLEAGPDPERTDQPGAYLMEADPAAIRGHALASFGLLGLGDSNGYLTGDEPVTSPWLAAFRVLHSGRGDARATREALRKLDAATPELKQRGAGLDLEKAKKDFKSSGTRKVYVAIWPIGKSLRHTIIERC